MSGKDVKATSRMELMELPKVKDALDQAEGQLVAYRTALARSRVDTLKLRGFAVVALGFERLVFRSSQADDPKPAVDSGPDRTRLRSSCSRLDSSSHPRR